MSRRRKKLHTRRGPSPAPRPRRIDRVHEAMTAPPEVWEPWGYELEPVDPIRYPTTLLPQVVGR